MKCTSCSTNLSDTAKFCPNCGVKVVRAIKCVSCGTYMPDGSRFCEECGKQFTGSLSSVRATETRVNVEPSGHTPVRCVDTTNFYHGSGLPRVNTYSATTLRKQASPLSM